MFSMRAFINGKMTMPYGVEFEELEETNFTSTSVSWTAFLWSKMQKPSCDKNHPPDVELNELNPDSEWVQVSYPNVVPQLDQDGK